MGNCICRASVQRFQGKDMFDGGIRLMEDRTQLDPFVTVENRRGGFPAHIAINALVVDVKWAGNIFREPQT